MTQLHQPGVGGFTNRRTDGRSHQVAPYPCPYCLRSMFADEVIDFGPTQVRDEARRIQKHHRSCKEQARDAARVVSTEEQPKRD